jgi:hypothetical protein
MDTVLRPLAKGDLEALCQWHARTEVWRFVSSRAGTLEQAEAWFRALRIKDVHERKESTGILKLISPTDCVKDRLAGYYYWDDQQCLDQAILVARDNPVDVKEIQRWSTSEGKLNRFKQICQQLEIKA